MKIRKTILNFFILLLTIATVCQLSSCERRAEKSPDVAVSTTEHSQDSNITEPQTQKQETKQYVEPIQINWTNFKSKVTDYYGYTYEITYKISPWILFSNTDIISYAWQEVGKGNPLPGLSDWGLNSYQGTYSRSGIPNGAGLTSWCNWQMTDMYYCVGQISVKNVTTGWDITEDNIRDCEVILSYYENNVEGKSGSTSIGKTFFTNKTSMSASGIRFSAQMKKNSWGPVSFVLMAPENFVPNYPDGQYFENMQNGALFANTIYIGVTDYMPESDNNMIKIGIIGKDGKYIEPNH